MDIETTIRPAFRESRDNSKRPPREDRKLTEAVESGDDALTCLLLRQGARVDLADNVRPDST